MLRAVENVRIRDRDLVEEAWKQLEKAFRRQVLQADDARKRGLGGSTQTLNEFYAALTGLKDAVKKHSNTPKHRAQKDRHWDKWIHKMLSAGMTYGQIARDWNRDNPQRTVTPNQAERAHDRYREREQRQLRWLFKEIFGQPCQMTPR